MAVVTVCTCTGHQVSGVLTVSGGATVVTAAGAVAAVATAEAAAAAAAVALRWPTTGALLMTDCHVAFGTRR